MAATQCRSKYKGTQCTELLDHPGVHYVWKSPTHIEYWDSEEQDPTLANDPVGFVRVSSYTHALLVRIPTGWLYINYKDGHWKVMRYTDIGGWEFAPDRFEPVNVWEVGEHW